jgi:hypothetical protein
MKKPLPKYGYYDVLSEAKKVIANQDAVIKDQAETIAKLHRALRAQGDAHRSVEGAWFDFDAAALERRRQQGGD